MKNVVGIVVLVIIGLSSAQARAATVDEAAVVARLNASAAAFEHRDLAEVQKSWVNDDRLTVFEGGHVNKGWVDYRDNHIGPEMKELVSVEYRLDHIVPHVAGTTAWATFDYTIRGNDGKRDFAGSGIGTAILEKHNSDWRIVHWHSTSRPKAT